MKIFMLLALTLTVSISAFASEDLANSENSKCSDARKPASEKVIKTDGEADDKGANNG